MRILITGATGNLGSKLRLHLEGKAKDELVLLDKEAHGDPDVHQTDLAVPDPGWERLFLGCDTVFHLAADHRPEASWQSVRRNNIDTLHNVLRASVSAGVKRLVFASSNWVMAGYRDSHEVLTTDLTPRPEGPYGVSKLIGEEMVRCCSEQHGLSAICLRIGAVLPGENRPEDQAIAWHRQMYLSNRDWTQLAEKAIRAKNIQFAVLNAMSANAGTRWDIAETRRLLGYEPDDGSVPPPQPRRSWKRRLRRLLRPQR